MKAIKTVLCLIFIAFMLINISYAQEEIPAWAKEGEPPSESVKSESSQKQEQETQTLEEIQPKAQSTPTEEAPAWAKEPSPTNETPFSQPPPTTPTPIIIPVPDKLEVKIEESPKQLEKDQQPTEPPKQTQQQKERESESLDEKSAKRGEEKSSEKKDRKRGDTSGLIYEGRSSIGGASIIGSKSNIGIKGGYLRLPEVPYEVHYLHLEPRIELLWTKFAFSIQAPLNFKIYDVQTGTSEMWKLRAKDWDEPTDYTKVIRFIKYGRKDDRIYANITTLSSSTLGHGTIMRRYVSNVDMDHKKLGIQLDINHDYLGFQSMISDIFGPPVFGVMPFVRPFAPFSDNLLASSLSIGFTFAADTDAPVTIKRTSIPNYKFSFPNGKPYINQQNRLEYDSTFLYIWGIDAHIKIVRTKSVDIKPYLDWSTIKDGGFGFTGGVLSRFAFGEKTKNFITLRSEYRGFQPNYEPTYFNTFYEFQKYQFFIPSFSDYEYQKGFYPTKREEILSRSGSFRHGYYLEFQYELSKYFSIGSSIENATGNIYSTLAKDGNQNPIKSGNGNFLLYISLPLPYFISAHFTYHKISYTDFNNILDFESSNTIILATLKFRPINLIGVYATLQESWQLDSWTGLYLIVPQLSLGVDLSYYF